MQSHRGFARRLTYWSWMTKVDERIQVHLVWQLWLFEKRGLASHCAACRDVNCIESQVCVCVSVCVHASGYVKPAHPEVFGETCVALHRIGAVDVWFIPCVIRCRICHDL